MTSVDGLARTDRDDGGLLRWSGALLVAATLHLAAGLALMPRDEPSDGPPAPEALVMIDLPPDLALPAMEQVESRASEAAVETEATEAEAAPAETVEATAVAEAVETTPVEQAATAAETVEAVEAPPPPDAPPPPETVETVEPTDTVAAMMPDTAVDAAGRVETVEASPVEAIVAPVAPVDTVVPAEVAVAPPPEATAQTVEEVAVADVRQTETVTAETPAPVPPEVTPRRKPPAPVAAKPRQAKPAPVRKAETKKPDRATARPAAPAAPAAVAGVAASGAGRPSKDALAAYTAEIRARILKARRSVATDGRRNIAVTVAFTVAAGGGVSGLTVTRSSGNADLDRAALDLIRRASPLPEIPPDVGRNSLRMALPVRLTH